MERDKRYKLVKLLFVEGEIKTLNDIFDTLPKSVLARDMGIKMKRFNNLMENLTKLTLEELYTISMFTGIDRTAIMQLFFEQCKRNKKRSDET